MKEVSIFDPIEVNIEKLNTMEMKQLDSVLHHFEKISLKKMDQVKLLNRFDSKYCLHTSQLETVLEEICNDYYILKVDGTRIQSYRSVYFDTPDDLFYLSHHNGIANRIKIRKREYVNSGLCFTEIKLKSNKGKTSKKRIKTYSSCTVISAFENHFISNATNQTFDKLLVKSTNSFNRITLVGKKFDERCTIDINIAFSFANKSLLLENLAVIELKQATQHTKSKLADTLKENRIYKLGFSKYCMGRALTENKLKKNTLKSKILKINKQFNPVILDKAWITQSSIAI